MRDEAEVRVNDAGDILYVGFGGAAVASCRAFGDLRNGVREALLLHGPPELRIDEHDSVFHPARGSDARRFVRSA